MLPPLSSIKKRSALLAVLDTFDRTDEDIFQLFEASKPAMVVHAFLGPERYRQVMYSLPGPAFAEALRLLSPGYFVDPYKRLHRYFHPAVVRGKGFRSLVTVLTEFRAMLEAVAASRRAAGQALGMAEIEHLLECARAMGDADMAAAVWQQMTRAQADGNRLVEPNTACYNHYMAVIAWDGTVVSKQKFNVRHTRFNYHQRARKRQRENFRGYRTGPGGARDQVVALFDEMAARGVPMDEDTFVQLMVAASREGDIVGVKRILQSVWGIDVDGLMAGEVDAKTARPLPTSSPLHPTNRLLFAVAHVFCSNNQLAMGLQVVDAVSRAYGVFVHDDTWQELLEWAFVLAQRRFGPPTRAKDNQSAAAVTTLDTVVRLYEMAVNPPYKLFPNMIMYNVLVKTAWERQNIGQVLRFMRGGRELFVRSLKRRNRVGRTLVRHQLSIAPAPPRGTDAAKGAATVAAAAGGSDGGEEESLMDDDGADPRRGAALLPQNPPTNPRPSKRGGSGTRRTAADYDTAHLSLSKIKAFRTINAVLQREHLEVSRDASLVERWVRLVMTGRRWVANERPNDSLSGEEGGVYETAGAIGTTTEGSDEGSSTATITANTTNPVTTTTTTSTSTSAPSGFTIANPSRLDTSPANAGRLEWELRRLPRFVREWHPFLPARPYYHLAGGRVELSERSVWAGGLRVRAESALGFDSGERTAEAGAGTDTGVCEDGWVKEDRAVARADESVWARGNGRAGGWVMWGVWEVIGFQGGGKGR